MLRNTNSLYLRNLVKFIICKYILYISQDMSIYIDVYVERDTYIDIS